MTTRFLSDYDGQISEVFFAASAKRLRQALSGEETILSPIANFLRSCPADLVAYCVTEECARGLATDWLKTLALPTPSCVTVLSVAPDGLLQGTDWARDFLIVRDIDGLETFSRFLTDKNQTSGTDLENGNFALWLSQALGAAYSDERSVFLPGGNVVSGDDFWISRRNKVPDDVLRSVSDQRLLSFADDAGRSIGLHTDSLLSLVGPRDGVPVLLVAKLVPVEIAPTYRSFIDDDNATLDRKAQRLANQGMHVVRNEIPFAPTSRGTYLPRCYNNVLVESVPRAGSRRPNVWLPTFQSAELDFQRFTDRNKEIWEEQLGFQVIECPGWEDVAPAEGALRCAINVLRRRQT